MADDSPPEDQPAEVEQPLQTTSDAIEKEAADEKSRSLGKNVQFKAEPWFRQLSVVLKKNVLLMWRRPIMLLCMLLSSVVSVVLAIAVGRDVPFDQVELTDCGTIDTNYYYNISEEDYNAAYSIPISYNENWRDGVAVAMLALGPLVQAVCCFLIVHSEFQLRMLGVLRSLGLRESVYWVSWLIPFVVTSFINSLLGGATAALVQVHVYQNTYFFGIFGSLFFLQIALVSASFFTAALLGPSRGGATWLILLMLIAAWVPTIVAFTTSSSPHAYESVEASFGSSSSGLFWLNQNSTVREYRGSENGTTQYASCDQPVLSEYELNRLKTPEQQLEVDPSQYFVGCYAATGLTSHLYSSGAGSFETFAMYLFPYTHFLNIWGNFLGYTGMPNRKFTSTQASMSPEDLAIASLPVPPNPENGKGTTLFPQGSTLTLARNYEYLVNQDSCPASELEDYFCENLYNCKGGVNPSPTTGSPSVLQLYGFLTSLCAIYLLLAAYFSIVFPRGNGAPQKWYFFLLPSYWCGGKDITSGDAEEGVVVSNVIKRFGDFEAVKGVNMKLEPGCVTALLGHNGAGKSTLSNVICCETLATEGDVTVFGYSVTKTPFAVRQLVGVCKQDDFLYPDLSAREHLELYAGLRGVPSAEVGANVQEYLESVDLATVQNQFSSSFSGGMKRRLSLVCSTIGGRPLVVLDEPTTGMDPISRRFVWRHIDAIKEDRVILLTTHAMEEADLLADNVAVMKKGELAAIGTPLELKSQYGSAIQFNILVPEGSVESTASAIQERFSESKEFVSIDPGTAGNIVVNITKIRQDAHSDEEGASVDSLAAFVEWLESTESGVSEYGFSNSSLEEVFLKVTNESSADGDIEDAHEMDDVCCAGCSTGCILCCLKGPCRCCCCPKLHSADDNNENEANGEVEEDEEAFEIKTNDIATFKPALNTRSQIAAILDNSFKRNWTGKSSIGFYVAMSLALVIAIFMAIYSVKYVEPQYAFFLEVLVMSFFLVGVATSLYVDRQYGLFYLMKTQGLLKSSHIIGHALYIFIASFAVLFVILSLVYATPLFRQTKFCLSSDDNSWSCSASIGNAWKRQAVPITFWEDEFQGNPVQLEALTTPGGYGKIFAVAIAFSLTMPGALFSSAYLPGHKFALILLSFIALAVSILPLLAVFLVPGQKEQPYPGENGCITKVCNSSGTEFDITTIGDMPTEFLDCVGSVILNQYRLGTSCVEPVASILPQFGLFQGLGLTYMAGLMLVSDQPEYVEQVLIPALGGGASCSGNVCTFPYAHGRFGATLGYMILGAVLLLLLGSALVSFFDFPGLFTAKLRNWCRGVLGRVRSAGSAVRALGRKKDQEGEKRPDDKLEEVLRETEEVTRIVKPLLREEKPENVEQGLIENLQIANHSDIPRDELPPVLVYKLRKVYPSLGGAPPKVALDSLDLHVPRGEVLGLLGKNGAGKTTALKVLSISHKASSGVALVAGYDVDCEQLQVFERLGNCPQFDLVWPGQSVQRHLEFFAHLKGLPRKRVKEIALSIATSVGLGKPEVYSRHAGRLSGGMRRRLSIAISLIGAPDVLCLDEPSTGLDPSTRNSIWNLVKSFSTEERAVIITTHMMVEADVLCNRIAIVSQGQLKVIATQQHLKNKFGSGYLLQLNLIKSSAENQSKALAFVREHLHKDAKLQTKQAKTLHIALPRDVDLTKVFRALYSPKSSAEGCINQFLLSQSSLEDVFLAVAE